MTDDIKEENNEGPKPPTVPLFQIPDAVLNSMSKEVAPDTGTLNNPVEWIIQQRKMAEAQVAGPKEAAPPSIQVAPTIQSDQLLPVPQKKANVPKVAWGGNDLDAEALTMLFFMVVKEISKDKKMKKYLKDLNIEIYNINDELLWP